MCRNCVEGVYSLLKSRRVEHILYTQTVAVVLRWWENSDLSTKSAQYSPRSFSTPKSVNFPLLSSLFSPLYTGPITNTTNYINK
jgi:hypothetical protein